MKDLNRSKFCVFGMCVASLAVLMGCGQRIDTNGVPEGCYRASVISAKSRGSRPVITIGTHEYEKLPTNLRVSVGGAPESFGKGTHVVVCPEGDGKNFRVAVDLKGRPFEPFLLLK